MMNARRRTLHGCAGVLLLLVAASATADEKPEAVLRAAMAKMHAAKTLTADMTLALNAPGRPEIQLKGTVAAMKPNFLRVELSGRPMNMVYAADGRNYYTLQGDRYQKDDLAGAPEAMEGLWEAEINAFFGGEKVFPKGKVTSAGSEKVDGVDCDLVKVQVDGARSLVYAIGKEDHLIHRGTQVLPAEGSRSFTQANTLGHIQLDQPKEAKAFAFTPPQGAKLLERPNFEAKLVPVGNDAPRFAVPSREGGDLALTDLLKGKKAVLVNFWFHG